MESMTILDNVESKHIEEVETVTIRFAGDSGDGMQLTGTQFTNTTAVVGNDISTLPDFPAEIRAPAGSLPGVSGFQLNFSNAFGTTFGQIARGGPQENDWFMGFNISRKFF